MGVPWKFAPVSTNSSSGKNDGIVGRVIQFDFEHIARPFAGVPRGAHHLRAGAQRIGVLYFFSRPLQ